MKIYYFFKKHCCYNTEKVNQIQNRRTLQMFRTPTLQSSVLASLLARGWICFDHRCPQKIHRQSLIRNYPILTNSSETFAQYHQSQWLKTVNF